MSALYKVVSHGRWPSGIDKPVAILRRGPEELERAYGLRFTPGEDDLDAFQEVGLQLRSGRPVLLLRYRNSPGPGTTVSIDHRDDAAEAMRELRQALAIPEGELAWTSDEVAGGGRREVVVRERSHRQSPAGALGALTRILGVLSRTLTRVGRVKP